MTDSNTTTSFIRRLDRQELWLVLRTQIAEYNHHRLLHLGFIFSLAIATSTLLCILVLNHASKQQYQQANAQLTSPLGFISSPSRVGE